MQRNYAKIAAAGAEVLAISTDDLSGAESIIAKAETQFPILYTSKNNDVPISYNVFDLHGDGLASASVFVIDTDGNIAWESIGDSIAHQVSGKEVIEVLTGLAG